MDIDSMTVGQLKEIAALITPQSKVDHPYKIGKPYLIRTVTMYYTGFLKSVSNNELCLTSAAWIPDTGRFSDALSTGSVNEVEPLPDDIDLIIGRGAIVDAIEWPHSTVPRSRK